MRLTFTLAGILLASGVGACTPSPASSGTPDGFFADGWEPTFAGVGNCPTGNHPDPSGKCVYDNLERAMAERHCWYSGEVGHNGVGRPCDPDLRPCDGLRAHCCEVDERLFGAVCTYFCNTQDDCAPDEYCVRFKHQCLPPACSDLFDVYYEMHRYRGGGFPCPGGAVNPTGLGTLCQSKGGQCASLAKATSCVAEKGGTLEAGANSFCSFECSLDADCGAGGACVYDLGPPFFCAPATCAAQFKNKLFLFQEEKPSTCM